MPLETATYIPDLVVSNPAHTDGLSQADSHMRLLKAVLKNTLPNFTDVALQSTQAQIDAAVASTTGASPLAFALGTAALPGLYVLGDPGTGFWQPASSLGQIGISLSGVQVALMSSTALVTTMSLITTAAIGAAAIASTGAYSGGTGQLVPIGAVLEWYDDTLPAEGGYCWANGQIITSANTVCPVLLARWGNKFGGNGVTTMGVPDRRDTVAVGKSTMGGENPRGLMTLANTVLGNMIGIANIVLTTLNLPAYTPSSSLTVTFPSTVSGNPPSAIAPGGSPVGYGGTATGGTAFSIGGLGMNVSQTFTAQGGTSTPFTNVQPSTTANFILRLG